MEPNQPDERRLSMPGNAEALVVQIGRVVIYTTRAETFSGKLPFDPPVVTCSGGSTIEFWGDNTTDNSGRVQISLREELCLRDRKNVESYAGTPKFVATPVLDEAAFVTAPFELKLVSGVIEDIIVSVRSWRPDATPFGGMPFAWSCKVPVIVL